VKIEMGARADHWPCETKSVTPYVAELFPKGFKQRKLALTRTVLFGLLLLNQHLSEAVWMSLRRERTRPVVWIVLITVQFPQIIKVVY
jgi:hypothetical protein